MKEPLGAREDRAAAALGALVAAARLGGETALAHFRPGLPTDAKVAWKPGDSPVTAADLEVDAQLAGVLRPAFPDAGWLSEETTDDAARLSRSRLLVLDPIDGTRAFMSGDPCWAVSIALIEDGAPVAGVVHAPALGETYAASLGRGATLNGAAIRAAELASLEGARIGGPRALIAALGARAGFRPNPAPRAPSLAYRLVSVAAGRLDIGLSAAHAHDWDVAAADIILREAGAGLVENGAELEYNRARTLRDALIAAPAAWLQRLA